MSKMKKRWIVKEEFCVHLRKNFISFDHPVFSNGILNSKVVDVVFKILCDEVLEKSIPFPTAKGARKCPTGLPETSKAKKDSPEVVKIFHEFINTNKDIIGQAILKEIEKKKNELKTKIDKVIEEDMISTTKIKNIKKKPTRSKKDQKSVIYDSSNDVTDYESDDGGIIENSNSLPPLDLFEAQLVLFNNAKKRKKSDSSLIDAKFRKIEELAESFKRKKSDEDLTETRSYTFQTSQKLDESLAKESLKSMVRKAKLVVKEGILDDTLNMDPKMTKCSLVLVDLNRKVEEFKPKYEDSLKELQVQKETFEKEWNEKKLKLESEVLLEINELEKLVMKLTNFIQAKMKEFEEMTKKLDEQLDNDLDNLFSQVNN